MSTQRGNDRLITVHAPFLVLAIAPNQKSLSNMAINCVGRKFENNLQTALKESLALFPVDKLKAEQRHSSEERCFQAIADRFINLSTVVWRI